MDDNAIAIGINAAITAITAVSLFFASRRASAVMVTDQSTICALAQHDAMYTYAEAIAGGYSSRAARSRVRAMIHNRYKLKPEYARLVLDQAIKAAQGITVDPNCNQLRTEG